MNKGNATGLKTVTMLGSMPPLRALSSYCYAFSDAVSRSVKTEFISFKHIYPSFLYPGGGLREDHTFPTLAKNSNLEIRRNLTWYNPLTWIIEGLFTKGQILHAQWWSPPLIFIYITMCVLFKLRKRPVVITVHNVVQHDKKTLYDFFSKILFKFADHFIVHSKSNKDKLLKLYAIPDKKLTQIPHGPLKFNYTKDISPEEARNKLGLHQNDKVVLFFGTIRPYKGLDIALKAFKKVVDNIPEARLVITGRPWEPWERYEDIINDNRISGYIRKTLDYIDTGEVAKYFMASDLVILPYLHFNSQSGAGAAALAFEKPMIVTKAGGLPELVGDKKNVVPPGDADALSERIIECLKSRSTLEQMSQEAKTIAEAMSWEKIGEDTVAVYEKLINEK